ncbi:MAG: hypothetical protein NTY53_05860 [Kiritimatiellaeota bacterium]|nr:hypothetical protein [Kiritimatiellota bacterium]
MTTSVQGANFFWVFVLLIALGVIAESAHEPMPAVARDDDHRDWAHAASNSWFQLYWDACRTSNKAVAVFLRYKQRQEPADGASDDYCIRFTNTTVQVFPTGRSNKPPFPYSRNTPTLSLNLESDTCPVVFLNPDGTTVDLTNNKLIHQLVNRIWCMEDGHKYEGCLKRYSPQKWLEIVIHKGSLDVAIEFSQLSAKDKTYMQTNYPNGFPLKDEFSKKSK